MQCSQKLSDRTSSGPGHILFFSFFFDRSHSLHLACSTSSTMYPGENHKSDPHLTPYLHGVPASAVVTTGRSCGAVLAISLAPWVDSIRTGDDSAGRKSKRDFGNRGENERDVPQVGGRRVLGTPVVGGVLPESGFRVYQSAVPLVGTLVCF